MRVSMAWMFIAALLPTRAKAQDSTLRVTTPPRVELQTNFGAYALLFERRESIRHDPVTGVPVEYATRREVAPRILADWGVVVPIDGRNAVGASLVVSLDEDHFFIGMFARYRRTLGGSRSVEVALGVPISNSADHRAGPLGLIKFNPWRRVGIGLRPELDRQVDYTGTPANPRIRTNLRVSAGVEVGGLPGAISSVAAGIAVVAAVIAFLASGAWS